MAGIWTNNFKALKNVFLCGDYIDGLSGVRLVSGQIYTTLSLSENGHGLRVVTSPMCAMNSGEAYEANNLFIRIGSGNSTPAATDYDLESVLTNISYLSIINEKPLWNTATGEVTNTVKLTLQNVGAEAVTVREWGVFAEPVTGWGNYMLIYRAVLDTPVTLAVNQSATLTLTRSVTLTDPVVWSA